MKNILKDKLDRFGSKTSQPTGPPSGGGPLWVGGQQQQGGYGGYGNDYNNNQSYSHNDNYSYPPQDQRANAYGNPGGNKPYSGGNTGYSGGNAGYTTNPQPSYSGGGGIAHRHQNVQQVPSEPRQEPPRADPRNLPNQNAHPANAPSGNQSQGNLNRANFMKSFQQEEDNFSAAFGLDAGVEAPPPKKEVGGQGFRPQGNRDMSGGFNARAPQMDPNQGGYADSQPDIPNQKFMPTPKEPAHRNIPQEAPAPSRTGFEPNSRYGGGRDRKPEDPQETITRLNNQIQAEKANTEATKKKIEGCNEEIALLKTKLESLEVQNRTLSQTVESFNESKHKSLSESSRILSQLESEKNGLLKNLEDEKSAHLDITIEISQYKAKLDQANKQFGNLNNQINADRTQLENDRTIREQLELENTQFREHWADIHQKLETESMSKLALTREIQELKAQFKQLEGTQAAFADISAKVEFLEGRYSEENAVRMKAEGTYNELLQNYKELERKRNNFETLRHFADKLSEDLPTFQKDVSTIKADVAAHSQLLQSESLQTDALLSLLREIKESSERQRAKHEELITLVTNLGIPLNLNQDDAPQQVQETCEESVPIQEEEKE
eukprot:TRINITY_DN4414_c0_g1_i1.p1 TRINITY_DN4414_c0_g1~~TRINITY_DN4414_c0_g1_i1.p1  ORF type:complete len:609 (+),score=128.42 TRINITY_DN4414_c0_g1_i1:59-1885(+)